jgi:hypothetical protein
MLLNIKASGQVGFVVDKVALGQVFSGYFCFPCQSSFHQLLHNHPHLSSGAGTIGQKLSQYKGLSPTTLAKNNIKAKETTGRARIFLAAIKLTPAIGIHMTIQSMGTKRLFQEDESKIHFLRASPPTPEESLRHIMLKKTRAIVSLNEKQVDNSAKVLSRLIRNSKATSSNKQ